MIIGIFNDVHGNLPALEAVIEDGSRQGVEKWFCLGDISFEGPAPGECLSLVRKLCPDTTVMGNTEEWLPTAPPGGEPRNLRWWDWTVDRLETADFEWVKSLPRKISTKLGNMELLFVHATLKGLEDILLPTAPNAEIESAMDIEGHLVVACGHIHMPYLRRVNGATVFNTGSVGRPIDGDSRSSYVTFENSEATFCIKFQRVKYGVHKVIKMAKDREFPWAEDYEKALRKGVNF